MSDGRNLDIDTARQRVLVDGLYDWIGFHRVHWRVTEANPQAALADIQAIARRIVREFVEDDLFEIGDLTGGGDTFAKWPWPLEESMVRVTAQYVDGYARDTWDFCCWLNLTDKGTAAAKEFDHLYANPEGL